MSGLWSRGYHGDCRDCVHYSSCFSWVRKDEWHCTYSGDYFNDEYGDQCHYFYDIAEQRAQAEKEAHKNDFAIGWMIGQMAADNDDDDVRETESQPIPKRVHSPLVDKIEGVFKGVLTLVFLCLVTASCFLMNSEQKANYLHQSIKVALYEDAWNIDVSGNAYLIKEIYVNPSLTFDKSSVFSIVQAELKTFNYQVRAGKNNRAIGLVVKPNKKLENYVTAYYTGDVMIAGTRMPRIILISNNNESSQAKHIRNTCEILPDNEE